MKTKHLILLLISLIAITNQSCKKEGCTDSNATNFWSAATKDDGSCKYDNDNTVKSMEITINNWNSTSSAYYTYIDWDEITQDILDHGVVLVYIHGPVDYSQLPFTWYPTSTYSETFRYFYHLARVEIDIIDSDLTQPANPGSRTFKIVAMSGNRLEEMQVNKIDAKNYSQVKEYLNLHD